ncbi:tRNA(Ile)-lysidine synthase [Companilactobacillus sp. RD055328]|uniref:tRNA lysidine(34) synthetase TilS n=1 Tax=Companilactobacillus sp. RD055328 TaxID=2916634 RepID=UPI001FC8C796|nr:tRNA lysidine(34) synthetase TilS [Companilactobacillus sp. RD055328]GKQ42285.1 tRNA(Ile)-lysidine synthase [Companilactobacillus sp. RD055328]
MRNLFSEFKQNVAELSDTISGNNYLLGVSGGVDSIVLFEMFLRLKEEFFFEFSVASIDHSLRDQSIQEVNYLRELCAKNNISFYTTKWEEAEQKMSGTSENSARKFRYEFFQQVMKENDIKNLVLAHHADDQTETVLMKLIRGGNIREVQAMTAKRDFSGINLLRPMLEFSKSEIIDYALDKKLDYFEDETNKTDFTLRNRLRNHVIPQMKEENPQVLSHFTDFTNQLQTANKVLERYYNPIFLNDFSSDLLSGTLRSLKELPISENILFWNIYKSKRQLFKLNDKQIKQISYAIKSEKPNMEIYLDDGLLFIKNHDRFTIEAKQVDSVFYNELPMNKKITLDNGQTAVLNDKIKNSNSIQVTAEKIPQKIVIRNRRNGDTLELSENHHQKLKKRMIDLKLSKKQKENALILTFDDKIVWVDGIYNIANYQKDKKYSFYLQIRGDVDETK